MQRFVRSNNTKGDDYMAIREHDMFKWQAVFQLHLQNDIPFLKIFQK